MKKVILGLASLLMVTIGFAQPAPGKHRGGHQYGAKMKTVNLTDAQKEQMKTINADFRSQMKALEQKENITVKEQRDQRAALVKNHREKIDNLLTAEQKAEMKKMREERRQKGEEMAAKRLDKMKSELNLSEAQVATIKSNGEKTKARMEAIMKDESVAREAKREQLSAVRKEMKANMDQVLTKEQKEKWDALQQERHEKMRKGMAHRMDKDRVK